MSAFIIGLTGGIGSGKSAITQFFSEKFSVPIIDADIISREVVKPDQPALKKISAHFGSDILTNHGELNRQKLREIIFSNHEEKCWLEALLHPLINSCIEEYIKSLKASYAILVSPLLFETTQYLLCDMTILVTCSEEKRISRVVKRDQSEETLVKAIIAQQTSDQQKCSQADHTISNNSTLDSLHQQCEDLHEELMRKLT